MGRGELAERVNWFNASLAVAFLTIGLVIGVTVDTRDAEETISKEKAGERTVNFLNSEVLGPSPNEVYAEPVNVTEADSRGLENFYEVNLNVTNPAGSQVTPVYTRKDGELVFLQLPRRMDEEFDDSNYY
jgi:hypothetical protein